MVLDAVSNFVRGNTDAAVGTSDTTVSVADASIFPDPETDGEFNVVIWDVNNFPRPDQDGDVEIMRVTARDTTADELTVTRGQEMTSAAAHPEGSAIHLSPTAKMFSDIESTFGDFWDAGTQELTADVNNTNTTTTALEAGSVESRTSFDSNNSQLNPTPIPELSNGRWDVVQTPLLSEDDVSGSNTKDFTPIWDEDKKEVAVLYDARVNGNSTINLARGSDIYSLADYDNNPVLPVGESGEWDSDKAYDVDVFRLPGDIRTEKYGLCYAGDDGGDNWGFGLAYSDDLENWTKDPDNPQLTVNELTDGGTKAKDFALTYGDGTYYVYYEYGEYDQEKIGLAQSTDLSNWDVTLDVAVPDQTDSFEDPRPWFYEGKIYLFFEHDNTPSGGRREIYFASSDDPKNFGTDPGELLIEAPEWTTQDDVIANLGWFKSHNGYIAIASTEWTMYPVVDQTVNLRTPAAAHNGFPAGTVWSDDFGDSRISARLSTHAHSRPEWETTAGSPTANGRALKLSGGDEMETPTVIESGAWELRGVEFTQEGPDANRNLSVRFMYEDGDNFWQLITDTGSAQEWRLGYLDGGAFTELITGSTDLTNAHSVRAERSDSGEWELFIDGASVGTATDAFLPETNSFVVVSQSNMPGCTIESMHIEQS